MKIEYCFQDLKNSLITSDTYIKCYMEMQLKSSIKRYLNNPDELSSGDSDDGMSAKQKKQVKDFENFIKRAKNPSELSIRNSKQIQMAQINVNKMMEASRRSQGSKSHSSERRTVIILPSNPLVNQLKSSDSGRRKSKNVVDNKRVSSIRKKP